MMIHEPLGDPADLERASSACAAYRDTIAQLRNEFQEFIAQTRVRLQFVCEALEQDRDAMSVEAISVESMRVETMCGETMCGETMCGETMCGETMCGETMCGETMCGGSSQPIPFAGEAIEPVSKVNSAPVIEPISLLEPFTAIRPSSAAEPQTRIEPASMNELSLSADDPFERINAIKQRLAKQIKSF